MPRIHDLEQEFLADHRVVTGHLVRLLGALRERDQEAVAAIARELDRDAGPHMDFEESHLYPALRDHLEVEAVDQLYGEHAVARSALRRVLDHEAGPPLSAEEHDAAVRAMELALSHTETCGALLGTVAGLDEERRQELLGHLRECRDRGRRWSELPDVGGRKV